MKKGYAFGFEEVREARTDLGTSSPSSERVTGALHLWQGERSAAAWIGAGFVLYLAVVAITRTVHVPRNDGIKAAGDPDRNPDLADVRRRFDETLWARWNLVRAVANMAAVGCLAWALVLHASTDPDTAGAARMPSRPVTPVEITAAGCRQPL